MTRISRILFYVKVYPCLEHNLDVIKVADHIIDLGPEGGDGGGRIVFEGTPEGCADCAESATGEYLRKVLDI
ncbi:MAG TPA: hypothetical protein H9785_08450 [Candidatus Bacteroides intestinavium]|uniref:UvrABC system protein A n=1 Tax=Candidatus Bacteroides intestinavium TaxID=2838469 RepID=A0A9D2HTW6_9BACE|nr:hypothetical protein [Candidatus Bacteroides intestinavium]